MTDSLHLWHKCSPWGDDLSCTGLPPGYKVKGHGHIGWLKFLPWFFACLTDSLHMWHKYNPWGDDVSHTISRSKGQKSSSRGLNWKFLLCPLFGYLLRSLAIYLLFCNPLDVKRHLMSLSKVLIDLFTVSTGIPFVYQAQGKVNKSLHLSDPVCEWREQWHHHCCLGEKMASTQDLPGTGQYYQAHVINSLAPGRFE